MATLTRSGDLSIWNLSTAEVKRFRATVAGNPPRLAFSPDGSQLAVTGRNDVIAIWDVDREEPVNEIKQFLSPVQDFAFDPGGGVIVAASADGIIGGRVTGTTAREFFLIEEPAKQLAVSKSLIASANPIGNVSVWSWAVPDTQPTLSWRASVDGVTCLAFSDDGTRLALGGSDRSISLFQATSGSLLQTFRGIDAAPRFLDIKKASVTVVTATGRVYKTELADGKVTPLPAPRESAEPLAWSPAGDRLLVGGQTVSWQLRDLSRGRTLAKALLFDNEYFVQGHNQYMESSSGVGQFLKWERSGRCPTFEEVKATLQSREKLRDAFSGRSVEPPDLSPFDDSRLCEQPVPENPPAATAWLRAAKLINEGQWDDAIQTLGALPNSDRKTELLIKVFLGKADQAQRERDFDLELEFLDNALEQRPRSDSIRSRYNTAVSKRVDQLIDEGSQALDHYDWPHAQQAFEAALKYLPGDAKAKAGKNLAELHREADKAFNQRQLEKAEVLFGRILKLRPDLDWVRQKHCDCLNAIGRKKKSEGNRGEAEETFKRVLAICPNNPTAEWALKELSGAPVDENDLLEAANGVDAHLRAAEAALKDLDFATAEREVSSALEKADAAAQVAPDSEALRKRLADAAQLALTMALETYSRNKSETHYAEARKQLERAAELEERYAPIIPGNPMSARRALEDLNRTNVDESELLQTAKEVDAHLRAAEAALKHLDFATADREASSALRKADEAVQTAPRSALLRQSLADAAQLAHTMAFGAYSRNTKENRHAEARQQLERAAELEEQYAQIIPGNPMSARLTLELLKRTDKETVQRYQDWIKRGNDNLTLFRFPTALEAFQVAHALLEDALPKGEKPPLGYYDDIEKGLEKAKALQRQTYLLLVALVFLAFGLGMVAMPSMRGTGRTLFLNAKAAIWDLRGDPRSISVYAGLLSNQPSNMRLARRLLHFFLIDNTTLDDLPLEPLQLELIRRPNNADLTRLLVTLKTRRGATDTPLAVSRLVSAREHSFHSGTWAALVGFRHEQYRECGDLALQLLIHPPEGGHQLLSRLDPTPYQCGYQTIRRAAEDASLFSDFGTTAFPKPWDLTGAGVLMRLFTISAARRERLGEALETVSGAGLHPLCMVLAGECCRALDPNLIPKIRETYAPLAGDATLPSKIVKAHVALLREKPEVCLELIHGLTSEETLQRQPALVRMLLLDLTLRLSKSPLDGGQRRSLMLALEGLKDPEQWLAELERLRILAQVPQMRQRAREEQEKLLSQVPVRLMVERFFLEAGWRIDPKGSWRFHGRNQPGHLSIKSPDFPQMSDLGVFPTESASQAFSLANDPSPGQPLETSLTGSRQGQPLRITVRCFERPIQEEDAYRFAREAGGEWLGLLAFPLAEGQRQLEEAFCQAVFSLGVRPEHSFKTILLPRTLLRDSLVDSECTLALNTSLSNWMGKGDPYDTHLPVTRASEFFGRSRQIAELRQSILASESFSILGPRRMGKTSIALRLCQSLPAGWLYAFCDAQGSNSVSALCSRVIEELLERFGSKFGGANPPVTGFPQFPSNDTGKVLEQFRQDLVAIRKAAGSSFKGLALFLDEIQAFVERDPQEASALLRCLKATSRELTPFAFGVIGAISNRINLGRGNTVFNPFFGGLRDFRLPPLTAQECSEMVAQIGHWAGLSYDGKSLELIYRESGGHPYVARQICSAVVSDLLDRPAHIDAGKIRPVLNRYLFRSNYLEALFRNDLTPGAQKLVEALARRGGAAIDDKGLEAIASEMEMNSTDLAEAMQDLFRFSMLERMPDGSYRFLLGILLRWLRRGLGRA